MTGDSLRRWLSDLPARLWGADGSAAGRHVNGLVRAERLRVARVLVSTRVVLAALMLVLHAEFGLMERLPDFLVTAPLWSAHAAAAVLLWVLARASERILALSPLAIALVDIPAVAVDHVLSLPHVASPAYAIGVLPGILALLVVLAAFSFSPAVTMAAAVSAAVGTVVLHVRLESPPSEMVVHMMPPVGAALLAVFLLRRLRLLVRAARSADFMGKYVLGPKIGTGGMAEVFRATYAPEGGFERQVAVKRILPAYVEDALFVELFRREAQVGAALAHPNLVQVLDYGRHEQSWFIALELVDGPTLAALVRGLARIGVRLPLGARLLVAHELAQALAYLHEVRSTSGSVGIVHRDVNPPNVLCSRQGAVKLSDFGVARFQGPSDLTRTTSAVRGKLAWMAPEQLEGRAPTPAWDLFALGLTLYELFTGRRPVTARDEAGVVKEILDARFEDPGLQNAELPRALCAQLLQLLARDPAGRGTARNAAAVFAEMLRAEGGFESARAELVAAVGRWGGDPDARGASEDDRLEDDDEQERADAATAPALPRGP